MVYLKFIVSIVTLPFLLPLYLTDRVFEYLFLPAIYRKFNLEISRQVIWLRRLLKYSLLAFSVFYFIQKSLTFYQITQNWSAAGSQWQILPMMIYNDIAKTINFLMSPVNYLFAVFNSGKFEVWKLTGSLYACLFTLLFMTKLIYRLSKTHLSINRAESLRDRAVRDVNIVRHAKRAKADEIFLGLELRRKQRPFYANRQWLRGHLQIIGEPGSGKTESLIQPLWFQEVRRNVATFVLDGKASRRNVDKFYTIAASLAQGQDILYFNPMDISRSDTYNPLLNGSASFVKEKIMASIDWHERTVTTRERLDHILTLFLQTMAQCHWFFNLRELYRYFQSREYLQKQFRRVDDAFLQNGLAQIIDDFPVVQSQLAFFIELLCDIEHSGYGQLLNSDDPRIDIAEIYHGRKDCYFTLPTHDNEKVSRFLGRLILQDMDQAFGQIAAQTGDSGAGLLVVDEMRKFAGPRFIDLLQTCRTAGVSVCYANQTLEELTDPKLGLPDDFSERLASQTNALCCFRLNSPQSLQRVGERVGKTNKNNLSADEKSLETYLRQLDFGQCLLHIRRPGVLTFLKTGYFKFDKLMSFNGRQVEEDATTEVAWHQVF